MTRAFHFLMVLWNWARGKFPMLPSDFVVIRYSVCKECDERRVGWIRESCSECGCTISPRRHPFNKLAHPCEECPLQNWSKVWGYGCFPNEGIKDE